MMQSMVVQRGCLLLADISGYTKYLAGVELEHSHDILTDLLETVARRLRQVMTLAKLEGDAIFVYDLDGGAEPYGEGLLDVIESSYFLFQRRIRTISHLTTCACDACTRIPSLGLKFFVHYGEFIRHEVMGNPELVGRDIVLVHRLLKNTITVAFGVRDYALYTGACLRRLGIDPVQFDLLAHRESYDDVGEVECYLHDLQTRWHTEQTHIAVFMGPKKGMLEVSADLPGSVEDVWKFMTSPLKRPLWQPGVLAVVRHDESVPLGVGTTAHCVHGDHSSYEEIVDWKPLEYVSLRWNSPLGEVLGTFEVARLEEQSTRVWVRMDVKGEEEARRRLEPVMRELEQAYRSGLLQLADLLTASSG